MKINLIKKGIKYFFIFLLGLVLLLAALPMLLPLEELSSSYVKEISQKSGLKVQIQEMDWHWFPFPHLGLSDIHISGHGTDIQAPSAGIYPQLSTFFLQIGAIDWSSLLDIHLDSPTISYKAPSKGEVPLGRVKEGGIHVPVSKVKVKNGILKLDMGSIGPTVDKGLLVLTKIDAQLMFVNSEIKGDIKCQSSFSKDLFVQGALDLKEFSYDFHLSASGLIPHKLLPESIAKYSMAPMESEANVKMSAQGKGLSSFKATIRGDFPCYVVKSEEKKSLFSCGLADLILEKKEDDLELNINQLVFTDPEIKLTGKVRRQKKADSPVPYWDIHLTAKDVNVDETRQKVLFLLGKEKVAREVCDIVRGGKAEEASFEFHGTSKELKKLELMKITALAREGVIHVPELDFNLKEASGPIIIRDAVLYGENLSARMGESRGWNGRIAYGLLKSRRDCKLSMDLDADISELPPVLKKLLKSPPFQEELKKFSHVRGKARGRLSLGDTKDKIRHEVHVDTMGGDFNYERLLGQVEIKKGSLMVKNDFVSWADVEGKVGENVFAGASGEVGWEKEPACSVNLLKASINSDSLLKELFRYDVLEDNLSRVISSVSGPLEVHDFSLEGPVLTPKAWKYSLSGSAKNIIFQSPLLPEKVKVREAGVMADQARIIIKDAQANIEKQDIKIDGELFHEHFKDWNGWLSFDGKVEEKMAEWVEEKGWIPSLYFPKIPCRLKGLKVSWNLEEGWTELTGRILPGSAKEGIWAELDLRLDAQALSIKSLEIKDGKKRFNLSLNQKSQPSKDIILGIEGELSGQSLDLLLKDNSLLKGEISGNLRMNLSGKDISTSTMNGRLFASDFFWPWGLGNPLHLKSLKCTADGQKMDLDSFDLQLDEQEIASSGMLFVEESGLNFELNAHAKELSLGLVTDLFKGKNGGEEETFLPVHGKLNIYVDKFTYKSQLVEAFYFTWQPFIAQINLSDNKDIFIEIKQAMLCNLNTSGTFKYESGELDGNLYVKTEKDKKVLFEEALPCLGLEKELIQGKFTMDGALHGMPGNWHDGKIKIKAKEGRIFKMAILAKIFSLVNVLDIFSGGLPDLFKEGYSYSVLDSESEIKDNVLHVKKLVIKGRGINIFVRGSVNLDDNQADLTFLIAPFKTLDEIISLVPILGKALEKQRGALITVPVGVRGDFNDPKVVILPPSAVGEEILRLVTDTIKLPFIIFESIIPEKEKDKE